MIKLLALGAVDAEALVELGLTQVTVLEAAVEEDKAILEALAELVLKLPVVKALSTVEGTEHTAQSITIHQEQAAAVLAVTAGMDSTTLLAVITIFFLLALQVQVLSSSLRRSMLRVQQLFPLAEELERPELELVQAEQAAAGLVSVT